MRRSLITSRPASRPSRIVEVSDDVMEGSFRTTSSSPSPPPSTRRGSAEEEDDRRSSSSSRIGAVSSSNHHHSEHGIVRRHHKHEDHHQQRRSGGTGTRQLLSSSAVRMIQHVESTVLPDGSRRNKVWIKSASMDGNWVISEEEEIVTSTSGGQTDSDGDDLGVWKACKVLFRLMVVILLFWMMWTYGLCLLKCVASTISGQLISISTSQRQNPTDFNDPGPSKPKPDAEEAAAIEETISALKTEMTQLKHTVENHESRLTSHDNRFQLLQVEISQVIAGAATAASLTSSSRMETVEQIIERVLAIPVGETLGGSEVTVGSVFGVLREEIGGTKIDDKLEMIEQQFRDFSNDLVGLKGGMKFLETNVKDLRQNAKVEMEKIVLPLLIIEIGKQISLKGKQKDDGVPFSGLSIKDVDWMIRRAIAKYDADKTGLPDLALESAGGSILSVRNTQSPRLRGSVVKSFWGFWLWAPPNTPRTIVQPGVAPGECWSFEGSVGNVVIKLAVPSRITGFTLEHIPKSVSRYGNIDSAPRQFQVLGLLNEHDQGHDFGTFEYEDKDEPLQYFSVLNKTFKLYPMVELKILSNHGNPKHTCVYRFRVHGSLD